jgi:hypothetical protein
MKRIAWCLGLILLMPSMAFSLERRDGAYYCTEKFAGGVAYDSALQQWRGGPIKGNENFVVKLQHASPPEQDPNYPDPNAQDRYYRVTITVEGHSSNYCLFPPPFIDDEGLLKCEVIGGLHIYIFNFDNHRFLEIYTAGYVDGSNDTPSVAGGLCTKISQ